MKKILTGSLETNSSSTEEDLEKESLDLLKKIFESDLFKQVAEEEMTKTLYTLIPPERGFKHHWFFNFETKRLENFHKDITVEVVSEYDEKSYVCRTNSTLIIVPRDFINLPLEN